MSSLTAIGAVLYVILDYKAVGKNERKTIHQSLDSEDPKMVLNEEERSLLITKESEMTLPWHVRLWHTLKSFDKKFWWIILVVSGLSYCLSFNGTALISVLAFLDPFFFPP